MGKALFFYHYTRHIDCRYKMYADKCLDEIIENIQKVNGNYADGLAGVGTGIEYLVQEGFIDGDTNEILRDFDRIISHIVSSFPGSIDMRTGITGYGKYYLARLNNPGDNKNPDFDTEFIEAQLSKIVDLLSLDYATYQDLFFVISFLPNIISLNINKEKAVIYFNYAVDLLETMVYEDTHFEKYPGAFNPLVAAILLFRSSTKIGNLDLADRASYFLEKYEFGFRPYLSEEYAVKWTYLYHILWKTCNRDIYQVLSTQWLEKTSDNKLNLESGNLIITGMMLLSMNKSINDDWLDWFPLF